MTDAALLLAGLVVSVAGMTCFALSINAHWRQLFGARPSGRAARIGLRAMAAGLLGLAFLVCAMADPVSMAALVWPMLLTVAALLVAAGLTIHSTVARRRLPKVRT